MAKTLSIAHRKLPVSTWCLTETQSIHALPQRETKSDIFESAHHPGMKVHGPGAFELKSERDAGVV
eukprot:9362580-Pyramimonas_sp.AAC.1